jgi:hypothetical protein
VSAAMMRSRFNPLCWQRPLNCTGRQRDGHHAGPDCNAHAFREAGDEPVLAQRCKPLCKPITSATLHHVLGCRYTPRISVSRHRIAPRISSPASSAWGLMSRWWARGCRAHPQGTLTTCLLTCMRCAAAWLQPGSNRSSGCVCCASLSMTVVTPHEFKL